MEGFSLSFAQIISHSGHLSLLCWRYEIDFLSFTVKSKMNILDRTNLTPAILCYNGISLSVFFMNIRDSCSKELLLPDMVGISLINSNSIERSAYQISFPSFFI